MPSKPSELPQRSDQCELVRLTPLNDTVFQAVISLNNPAPIFFHAGQYLDLIIGNEHYSFSIGSAYTQPTEPTCSQQIELHIGVSDPNSAAKNIIEHLEAGKPFQIEMPKGCCRINEEALSTHQEPLILIAAGTGFAQAKSIIEHTASQSATRPIHLYWGARVAKQFYLLNVIQGWKQTLNNIHVTLALSDEDPTKGVGDLAPLKEGIAIQYGNVHKAVLKDFKDISKAEVYICGSPAMVYAVFDHLKPIGLSEHNAQSDVFEYLPRDVFDKM